ncbi:hypothetical protein HG530_014930 [Fusarium avenaceum]|nr:hypothetical protein HG530_014930 [Fusarium avenaceum]
MHAGNLSNSTRLEQLEYFGVMREDLLAPRGIDGHGFLSNDIAAELQSADDVYVMRSVHGCNDNLVRLSFFNHLVKVAGEESWDFAMSERLKF